MRRRSRGTRFLVSFGVLLCRAQIEPMLVRDSEQPLQVEDFGPVRRNKCVGQDELFWWCCEAQGERQVPLGIEGGEPRRTDEHLLLEQRGARSEFTSTCVAAPAS